MITLIGDLKRYAIRNHRYLVTNEEAVQYTRISTKGRGKAKEKSSRLKMGIAHLPERIGRCRIGLTLCCIILQFRRVKSLILAYDRRTREIVKAVVKFISPRRTAMVNSDYSFYYSISSPCLLLYSVYKKFRNYEKLLITRDYDQAWRKKGQASKSALG